MEEVNCPIEEFPSFYDVAFGGARWCRTGQYSVYVQCNFLEEIFKRHTELPIKSVMELGCGPAYHALRLAEMGYKSAALDISEKMIRYARKKAAERGAHVKFYRADIKSFNIGRKFDACICMLDLIRTLQTNERLISHFRSVANALNKGGLYVAEMCHPAEMITTDQSTRSWTAKSESMKTKCQYALEGWNFEKQTQIYSKDCIVQKAGRKIKLLSKERRRILMPQEFKILLQVCGNFLLCRFYGAYDTDTKLDDENAWRTIAVLKKVQ